MLSKESAQSSGWVIMVEFCIWINSVPNPGGVYTTPQQIMILMTSCGYDCSIKLSNCVMDLVDISHFELLINSET